MDIYLYKNRNGLWIARVTMTDPKWDGETCKLPPVITRYTEPDYFRHLALVKADQMITKMTGENNG